LHIYKRGVVGMSSIKLGMINLLFISFLAYSAQKELVEYKQLFFQNCMIDDIRPKIMAFMNYPTNIQFIRTCIYLYDQYNKMQDDDAQQTYAQKISLNFDIKHYHRALFYYVPRHTERARDLLHMQKFKESRKELLNMFEVDDSSTECMLDFYQQKIPQCSQFLNKIQSAEDLKFVLRQGFSPNIEDDKGSTLIGTAAFYLLNGYLEVLLQDKRTDPNILDKSGTTALRSAAYHNNVKGFELLLKHSSTDPNITDYWKNTPLMSVIEDYISESDLGKVEKIVEMFLLDKRTDLTITNNKGETALLLAYKLGHRGIIDLFKKHKGFKAEKKHYLQRKNVELYQTTCISLLLPLGLAISIYGLSKFIAW